MRTVKFKMERPGLVSEGQEVNITEKKVALNYTYFIQPAVAMSSCYRVNDRLKSRKGIVKKIEENERGYYVYVEFNE